MKVEYQTYEYDGIIIGGGGAGLKAAIEAKKEGAKVAVVMKCLLGKAHTVMAEGGMSAVILPNDSPEKHFVDTIIGGYGINDWEKVWKMVNKGKEVLLYLESKGAIFDRDESGNITPRAFGGHSERRTCHVSDRTGHAIIHTLKNELLSRDIDFFEKVIVTKLLVNKKRVVGAAALDVRTGQFILFKAKFVILATGGCGGLYEYTSNSKDLTGDGMYLAYEAGAELSDMEMVQIHPTCMLEPDEKRGILVTEACRGEGGILVNKKGERFMKTAKNEDGSARYAGKMGHVELETRDVVARAIEVEYEKDLGPVKLIVCRDSWENEIRKLSIPVYFQEHVDRNRLLTSQEIKARLSTTYEQFEKFAGVDITKEGMIVRPAQHYMMGGVRVDAENFMTCVQGLFAAGEVASGVHGANRLGANSLTDIQVEGMEAGRAAAEYADSIDQGKIETVEVEEEFSRLLELLGTGEVKQARVRNELKRIMWKHTGMKKNEEGLLKALVVIQELKETAEKMKVGGGRKGNISWQEAIETVGMLNVAEAIVRSSLARQESRGSHYRTDYPKMDKRWVRNTVCRKGKKGDMKIADVEMKRMPERFKKMFPAEWISRVYE
ncbi:FAD-binding protein [Candidatus Micrarchaeota archaeon]|nr:FAD-binding protein [Candidatus Micrarchaeota archaeon]